MSGWQPWDLLNDLAVARGLRGGDADSDSRYLRGRIAAVLWIPGLGVALMVGGWTGSWLVGVAILVLTLAVMTMIALGPRRLKKATAAWRRKG